MFDWFKHIASTEMNGWKFQVTSLLSSFRAKTAGQRALAYTLEWFTLSSNKAPVMYSI